MGGRDAYADLATHQLPAFADRFFLRGFQGTEVIDLSHVEPNALIGVDDLAPHAGRVTAGSRLLLRTDWDLHAGDDDYRTKESSAKQIYGFIIFFRKLIYLFKKQLHTEQDLKSRVHENLNLRQRVQQQYQELDGDERRPARPGSFRPDQ